MDARLLISTVLLAACHAASPSSRASRDSAAATVHADSQIATPLSAPIAVCESVAVLWRATGRATVLVTDTVAQVQTDSIEKNQGRLFTNVHGCATSATAPQGINSAQHALLYWTTSEAHGWVDLQDMDADGPDGNVRTRQRAGTRCQIDQSYDGGSDSDSTYVPSPRTGEVTICWRSAS